MYQMQVRIREFEDKVADLYAAGRVPGFVHLSTGQEAVAAGACLALQRGDVISTNHRGHGHCIAKGGDPKRMMAEIFGRQEGYCLGVGGSMHIADLDLGILGANGVVGASIAIATGAAFAFQVLSNRHVAVCFFGEGATNSGAFHESLNLAALWKLPVVFICENNGYAELTPESVHRAHGSVAERAAAYGISNSTIDGTDAVVVYQHVYAAAEACRGGLGPVLVEATTNRWRGHFEGDLQTYRPAGEVDSIRLRDPVKVLAGRLTESNWADQQWFDTVRYEAIKEIESAIQFAEEGSPLDFEKLPGLVYA